jgi:Flp pilus assembly protein TadG
MATRAGRLGRRVLEGHEGRPRPHSRPGRHGRKRDEAGISTVEVVIGTPILFLFVVTMVGLGLYAQNVGQVQDAAQDAARMSSLQRTTSDAYNYAYGVAKDDLGSTCNDGAGGLPTVTVPTTSSGTDGVTLLTITVECKVTELGITYTIDESSYAPVDTYRGGQP